MCKFCDNYNYLKKRNSDSTKKEAVNEMPIEEENICLIKFKHKLKVMLADLFWPKSIDGRKRSPSVVYYGKYDINFCPVCGKYLKKIKCKNAALIK